MALDPVKFLRITKEIMENRKEIVKLQAKIDKMLEELHSDLSMYETDLLRNTALEAVPEEIMDEQYDSLQEALDSIEGETKKHYIVVGLDTAKGFHPQTARCLRVPESELQYITIALKKFSLNKQLTQEERRCLDGNYIISDTTFQMLDYNKFIDDIKLSFNYSGMSLYRGYSDGRVERYNIPSRF